MVGMRTTHAGRPRRGARGSRVREGRGRSGIATAGLTPPKAHSLQPTASAAPQHLQTISHALGLERPICLSEIQRGTGISLAHLSKIFKGTRTPSSRTARAIAQHLRVTTDALYGQLLGAA